MGNDKIGTALNCLICYAVIAIPTFLMFGSGLEPVALLGMNAIFLVVVAGGCCMNDGYMCGEGDYPAKERRYYFWCRNCDYKNPKSYREYRNPKGSQECVKCGFPLEAHEFALKTKLCPWATCRKPLDEFDLEEIRKGNEPPCPYCRLGISPGYIKVLEEI